MNITIKDVLAVLPDGPEVCTVCISNGVITSVSATPDGFIADKTILGSGKMLIPGFVNAHTHASMTIFRNCADDLLFNDWLFGRIMPLEDKLTADDCYWGSKLAVMEMLSSGTTAFIDMYYFMDALTEVVKESGIRAVLSRGLIGGADNHAAGEMRLREALDAIDQWKSLKASHKQCGDSGRVIDESLKSKLSDHMREVHADSNEVNLKSKLSNHMQVPAEINGRSLDNLSFMLAPHAPYTCDEGFQREVAAEAKRHDLAINTHLCESVAEIETIREKYGCSPIELFDRNGLLSDTTIAAHCVQVSDSDIDILAKRGVCVATNPISNLKLANGVAPIPKMLKAGVKVALGTDGAASNNALNMFRELSVLTLIHKGINHDALAINAREGFAIATKNGAAAMGRSDIGEIVPGNVADLVILDLDRPNMQPVNNPVAALAYSANGSEVETVIVGGNVLIENGEFLTIDAEKTVYEVSKICERIGTR